MHPYLTRLGIRTEVQELFAPFILRGANDLLFQQGKYREAFGLAFHRVEANGSVWINGFDTPVVKRVLVGASVMDLIVYWDYYGYAFPDGQQVILIATGAYPTATQLQGVSALYADKPLTLLFPADTLGAIADLKVAAAFRRMPAAAFLAEKERINISFRAKIYEFDQQAFSLNKFERAAKFRFNVTTRKPKHSVSFLEQLQADAFPSY